MAMDFRWMRSLLLALLFSFGLFWLLQRMMSGEHTAISLEAVDAIDFVRLRREAQIEAKPRSRPPPPPPPKQPPPPPKIRVNTQVPQQQVTPFNLPALNLPTTISGGPFLGTFQGGGGALTEGDLIPLVRLQPQYPRQAARDGVEGFVRLEITVNADGTVREARVLDAKPRGYFEAAAVNAAHKGKFKPKVVDGVAVESKGQYTMTFKLEGGG